MALDINKLLKCYKATGLDVGELEFQGHLYYKVNLDKDNTAVLIPDDIACLVDCYQVHRVHYSERELDVMFIDPWDDDIVSEISELGFEDSKNDKVEYKRDKGKRRAEEGESFTSNGSDNHTFTVFTSAFSTLRGNVKLIGGRNISDLSHLFECCTEIECLDLSEFEPSVGLNIADMFIGCNSLKTVKVTESFYNKLVKQGAFDDYMGEIKVVKAKRRGMADTEL